MSTSKTPLLLIPIIAFFIVSSGAGYDSVKKIYNI